MPLRSTHARALPFHLWAMSVLYCLASLVHFMHNAEHIAAYPNLPAWLTREGVYLAWLAITAVGVAGVLLARGGWRVAGATLLGVYGSFGLYGLAHYARAPLSQHSLAMNASIWFEAVTGAALAVAAAWFVWSKLRGGRRRGRR